MYNNLPPPPGPQQWAAHPHANGALPPGPAPPPPPPPAHPQQFPPPDLNMQLHQEGPYKEQYTPHAPVPPHAGGPDAAVAPWDAEPPGLPPPPPPPDQGMGQVLLGEHRIPIPNMYISKMPAHSQVEGCTDYDRAGSSAADTVALMPADASTLPEGCSCTTTCRMRGLLAWDLLPPRRPPRRMRPRLRRCLLRLQRTPPATNRPVPPLLTSGQARQEVHCVPVQHVKIDGAHV